MEPAAGLVPAVGWPRGSTSRRSSASVSHRRPATGLGRRSSVEEEGVGASEGYLLLSLWGLLWTASAWFGFRHLGPVVAYHIAWQMLATLAFAGFGGLEGAAGALGLAASFVSWAGLVGLQRRAGQAGAALEHGLRDDLGKGYRGEIPADRLKGLLHGRLNFFKNLVDHVSSFASRAPQPCRSPYRQR